MTDKKVQDKKVVDNDNELFKKLRKLINLVDQLRDVGVQEYIQLPRIASLGTQSSGKSSVLESIVGLDFLPRGDGVVTRRPLELRLNHINDGTPWAIFDERKGEKFTDFNKVRETIEKLTDEVCAGEKNIVDKPIVLNVFSQTCPDLTLIDLPGITRVPVGKQPKNIEEITKNMAKRYCEDPLTIILCVIAANSDIATSDGLKMAKELDTKGVRTLGVLTKVDIMDKGTDAKKVLLNQEIPLKLGYIAVKNRSKQDLIDKISMEETIRKEKSFFKSHPIYKHLPETCFGNGVLIQKLTKILFRIIRENLPGIIKSINDQIRRCEEELKILGTPMPTDEAGKISMIWNLLSEYCEIFKHILKGKYDPKRAGYLKEEGGFKIKAIFKNLLDEFTGDYKATACYTDANIDYAFTLHAGESIPGFPSVDAFLYLLKPRLEQLKEPVYECYSNVYSYLEMLSTKILEKTFSRYPKIISTVSEFVSKFLLEEKEKAKILVDSIIDMDINHLFTNDYDYMTNWTQHIPKGKQNNPALEGKSIFIREIRGRIEAYFKLIVRNLRDSIPKALGYTLVKTIENDMKMKLYEMLYNDKKVVSVLNEPEGIARQRTELMRQIKVMKDAQKVIKKDPDLMNVMQIKIDEADIAEYEKGYYEANHPGEQYDSNNMNNNINA
jgi:GTP-binding protein EngB required for normal cell division